MSSNNSSGGGSIFMSLLAILFIGLKLTGFIDWSWWWVLAPIWGPIALVIVIIAVALPWLSLRNTRDWRRR